MFIWLEVLLHICDYTIYITSYVYVRMIYVHIKVYMLKGTYTLRLDSCLYNFSLKPVASCIQM